MHFCTMRAKHRPAASSPAHMPSCIADRCEAPSQGASTRRGRTVVVPRMAPHRRRARARAVHNAGLSLCDGAFSGSSSSMTFASGLTPRSPRRLRFLRNSVQKGLASLAPTFRPSTSRWPSVFTPAAAITTTFTYFGAAQERAHALVEPATQPADLALGHAARAERVDEGAHRAGGDALHIGLLDADRERLLRRTPWPSETRGRSCPGAAWGSSARRCRRAHPSCAPC